MEVTIKTPIVTRDVSYEFYEFYIFYEVFDIFLLLQFCGFVNKIEEYHLLVVVGVI